MTALVIKDLSCVEELDGSTMAEVRGGWFAFVGLFKHSDPPPPPQTLDSNMPLYGNNTA